MPEIVGCLSKMEATLGASVNYRMVLGDERVEMTPFLGKNVTLKFTGIIHCQACDRIIKKSYSGGFCFPCAQKLAQCDLCFMKPETCHYEAGTCREPEWGEAICMQDHIVYLANSSGLKVGITRINQLPTRWIDQGAVQGLPIFRVSSRYQSGLVEVMFKSHVSDRTNWRKMLKEQPEPLNLINERDRLFELCAVDIDNVRQQFGEQAIIPLLAEKVTEIDYPILQYPEKVTSLNFDKSTEIKGKLQGIKGQYLILDTGVLNIRKFSGYQISMVQ